MVVGRLGGVEVRLTEQEVIAAVIASDEQAGRKNQDSPIVEPDFHAGLGTLAEPGDVLKRSL